MQLKIVVLSILGVMLFSFGFSSQFSMGVQDDGLILQDSSSLRSFPDSLGNDVAQQDTLKEDDPQKETRRARREREQREKEALEPVVFKDSTRLAIEAISRKAWRRSAVVPGWGQYTNGGLWWIKVPVIYGGFVTTVLVFEFNNRYYHSILKDVQYRLANNDAIPPNSPYDYIQAGSQGTQYLISAKDYYRRTRDITILATLGWYGLNVIEAYVDSMLKNRWDIGDDLTFKVQPTLIQNFASTGFYTPVVPGLKISFQFPN